MMTMHGESRSTLDRVQVFCDSRLEERLSSIVKEDCPLSPGLNNIFEREQGLDIAKV